MISPETTQTFLVDFIKSAKEDPSAMLKMLAELYREEPNFCAFMTVFHSNMPITDPAAAALTSVMAYNKMRKAQSDADDLKTQMG